MYFPIKKILISWKSPVENISEASEGKPRSCAPRAVIQSREAAGRRRAENTAQTEEPAQTGRSGTAAPAASAQPAPSLRRARRWEGLLGVRLPEAAQAASGGQPLALEPQSGALAGLAGWSRGAAAGAGRTRALGAGAGPGHAGSETPRGGGPQLGGVTPGLRGQRTAKGPRGGRGRRARRLTGWTL